MGKRIVIWSGGYDSTLCLWNELENHQLVEAWSFNWDSILKIKTKCEYIVRRKFKRKISRKKWAIDHKIITLEHSIGAEGTCVMQAAMFIPMVNYLAPRDSTIIWGFHYKDDYWNFHDKFMDLTNSQNKLMSKTVNHEFPLMGLRKFEIISKIKNLGLENCVWTYEFPEGVLKSCGKCEPCINYKLALKEKELRNPSGAKLIINGEDPDKIMIKEK